MDMDVGQHGSREAQSARGCCHCCCGSISIPHYVVYDALGFSRCGGFATTGKGKRRRKRNKERHRERETEKRNRKDGKECERKD